MTVVVGFVRRWRPNSIFTHTEPCKGVIEHRVPEAGVGKRLNPA